MHAAACAVLAPGVPWVLPTILAAAGGATTAEAYYLQRKREKGGETAAEAEAAEAARPAGSLLSRRWVWAVIASCVVLPLSLTDLKFLSWTSATKSKPQQAPPQQEDVENNLPIEYSLTSWQ